MSIKFFDQIPDKFITLITLVSILAGGWIFFYNISQNIEEIRITQQKELKEIHQILTDIRFNLDTQFKLEEKERQYDEELIKQWVEYMRKLNDTLTAIKYQQREKHGQ